MFLRTWSMVCVWVLVDFKGISAGLWQLCRHKVIRVRAEQKNLLLTEFFHVSRVSRNVRRGMDAFVVGIWQPFWFSPNAAFTKRRGSQRSRDISPPLPRLWKCARMALLTFPQSPLKTWRSLTAHHFSQEQEFSWLSAPREEKNIRLQLQFLFRCFILLVYKQWWSKTSG